MRYFDKAYLEYSRHGLWTNDRQSLSNLNLSDHSQVIDVGAGDGSLTQVLVEECETSTEIVAVDYDRKLFNQNRSYEQVQGDARILPFHFNAVDLVVCQTLLVNIRDPDRVVSEFSRIAKMQIGAIEPDNSAVTVESTVADEADIDREAREAILDGSVTDMAIGGKGTEAVFNRAGLERVTSTAFTFEKTIEPPYSSADFTSARIKASGARITDSEEILAAGHLTSAEIEGLREQIRYVGRRVVEQMLDGTYHRCERIPFYVTTGYIER